MAYSKNRRLAEIVSDTSGNLSVEGIIVPTQSSSDNDTSAASTAFVHAHIDAILDSAPGTLNTLNEIAAALNDDANFNTTVTNAIAAKLPLAGGTMTGNILIDSSSSASIGLDRGNDTSGSTIDFKTGGTLKWYMGLRGLSNDNFYLRNQAGSTDALTILTDGKVGIGTTAPAFENGNGLEIRNSSGNGAHLKLTDNASGTGASQGFDLYMFNSQGYIENYENAPIVFRQNGGESARFDASGNFGIGTSPNSYSSQTTLTINGATYGRLDIESSNTLRASLFATAGSASLVTSTDVLSFDTSGGEAMRIDASGRVGIGMTPDASKNFALDVQATSGGNALRLKGRNAAENAGWLAWTDYAGNVEAAMYATADNLIFANTTSYTERMRIDANGKVGISESGVIYASRFSVGKVPSRTPGNVFTSSPSSFFSEATLGNSVGDAQKIAIFAGEDTANVSGLAVYRYRRAAGSNWTGDGFSLRQEVDNTTNIYDYINFAGGNVGIGTQTPDSKLDVNGVINIKSNPIIDSDGASHYLKAPNLIYFYPGNTGTCYMQTTGFHPMNDNAVDLGKTSNRWRNIYTGDLHLSNEGSQNDVDGTSGNWTIQEGEEHLFIINNKNGKKFKFALEEVE